MSPNAILASLKTTWEQWSMVERIRFGVAIGVCLAVMGGLFYWSSVPEYVLLVDHAPPTQAQEAVAALESAGIGYQLGYSGTTIYVPRSDVSRSRLALGDIISEQALPVAASGFDSFWPDPETQQQRQLRELESRLEKSLTQLKPIRSAKVHLTQTKASPFVRDRQPAKASVIIEPADPGDYQRVDTQAIVSLIASGVQGLEPANISVLDTTGRLLSSEHGITTTIGSQMEYRSRLEASLAAKAESMLAPLLGANKSHVRVTADIDFTETEREQITFDPDQKVKLTENIRTEQTSGGTAAAGAAGSPANVGRPTSNSSSQGTLKREDIDTTYENSKTVDSIRELPGKTQRLTVAAVVELPEAENGAVAVTQKQVESIIKQAVGFDLIRNDSIEVVVGKLQDTSIPLAAPTWMEYWSSSEPLLRSASLGLGAIVALVLGYMSLRRITPVVVPAGAETEQLLQLQRNIERLQDEIRDDPQHVADLLTEWLQSDVRASSSKSTSTSAAA